MNEDELGRRSTRDDEDAQLSWQATARADALSVMAVSALAGATWAGCVRARPRTNFAISPPARSDLTCRT